VLHTREVNGSLMGRVLFGRKYEVAAAVNVNVPSRLPARMQLQEQGVRETQHAAASLQAPSSMLDRQVAGQLDRLQEMIEKLCNQPATASRHDLPESLFRVFTDMIEAEVDEAIARSLIDRFRGDSGAHAADPVLVKARIAQLLEDDIRVTGPIRTSADKCRLVALVGPTGVGKTTTIAKLAANYRLREKKRVGLITVDTYRVAAVEQLRTYADIIDLPMEVVATPREMREAVARMRNLDLVLMDTAGRSPRDEIRIQELRALLAEAEADDVLLVLSATTGTKSLAAAAERFGEVGTTALLLTKLDEATSLGHLVALTRQCRLPISYLTDGQNVPDDIQVAEARRMSYMMLGIER
jgi:flagellar biosynthesis protein FlhF